MAPDTSHSQRSSTIEENKQPEYAMYKSKKHFFDQKRLELLEQLPLSHAFHKRVKRKKPGHLKQPSPPGQPRPPYSAEQRATEKTKRANKKAPTKLEPEWCLRRRQLIEMWNMDIRTKRQAKDRARAGRKMVALARKFKLVEHINSDTEAAE
jgi:hypothetical protein